MTVINVLVRVSVLVAVCAVAGAVAASSAEGGGAAGRFVGFVADDSGRPTHGIFSPDEVFGALVFIDNARSGTRYRVCWTERYRGRRGCWTRVTGARGTQSRFRPPRQAGELGDWTADWYVAGRRVARWRVTIVMA